ncbi:MAG: condensation domain-containing protein [Clostridiaceae bacterium]|nr:condensation domain-containing protein [Clostridiaceae bacterium]
MPKKYKAEMWDTVQKFFETYNDHMMHVIVELRGRLDIDRFKQSFLQLIDIFPIFTCKYRAGLLRANWVKQSFNLDAMFQIVESGSQREMMNFLANKIEEEKGPQIKIAVFRGDDHDNICFLINHMLFDGNNLKEMLYLLSRCYENLATDPRYKDPYRSGSRAFKQLYKNFKLQDKIKSALMLNYGQKNTEKNGFPYEKSIYASPRFVLHDYDATDFKTMRDFGKLYGCTFNDVFLTIYSRATARVISADKNVPLELDCIVDLRRYLKEKQTKGLTNFVSKVICQTENPPDEDIVTAVKKMAEQMNKNKSSYPGLQGLALLRFASFILPYPVARATMLKVFNNPLVALSNIGLVDGSRVVFDEPVKDVFMTGSMKYAPYIQLSCVSCNNVLHGCVALHGTDRDEARVNEMYAIMDKDIEEMRAILAAAEVV